MKRAPWLLGALIAACDAPPTQAVVELDLEPLARAALSRIEVRTVDAQGTPYGGGVELDLAAPYARAGAPSFGALLGEDDTLRLRLRGYEGSSPALRLEQLYARPLAQGVTHLQVTVRDACLDELPCRAACGEDGAGDLPGCGARACELGSPEHCGACDVRCDDTTFVAARSCVAGQCSPSCEAGHADCNAARQNDGCETKISSDAANCGSCGHTCTYDVCMNGRCAMDCLQTSFPPAVDAPVEALTPFHLLGQRIDVSEGGMLAGLGIHLAPRSASAGEVRFRMGLYTSSGTGDAAMPSSLLDQTTELLASSVAPDAPARAATCRTGALEDRLFNRVVLEKGGTYWIVLATSARLEVLTEALRPAQRVLGLPDVSYSAFNPLPPTPYVDIPRMTSLRSVDGPYLHVYPVITPLP